MQLLRFTEAVGLPVVCAKNGKKAGMVKEIIINPSEREVTAFLLERKGLELGKKQVLFKNVLGIGRDALVIDNTDAVTDVTGSGQNADSKAKDSIMGLHVFEKSGTEIGVVADVIFDIGTGRIEGVEISDGLLQDLVQGRQVLPLFGKVEFGEDNLMVEKEAVEEMANNGKGIKNKLLS